MNGKKGCFCFSGKMWWNEKMNIFIWSYFRISKELLRDKYSYSCTKSGITRNKLTTKSNDFLILPIMMIKLPRPPPFAFLPLLSYPIILFFSIFLKTKFSNRIFQKSWTKKPFGGYRATAGQKEWISKARLHLSLCIIATKVKYWSPKISLSSYVFLF